MGSWRMGSWRMGSWRMGSWRVGSWHMGSWRSGWEIPSYQELGVHVSAYKSANSFTNNHNSN
eukprot:CAMPEP_0203747978 /NCGR_PEP_ID=MMETSP0098-20131031/2974_1 /ASSEMBLY_ACC=CAM_ASM_000208 /TAXON_ID=96639 /ORGANISM=" , Strain NY0313808BC1" /LENGTH=61 /DNA_ID=CAMNT_0050636579 /DNA_START=40 /DNA_END=222 /DNA_ORIENTATION=+